jgi:hypothetical protein
MKLDNEIINDMFMKCLSKDKLCSNVLELDTIWGKYKFDILLVKTFEKEIVFLLKQLSSSFFVSLDDAIINKEGKRWGERTSAIQLFLLGSVINKVDILKEKNDLPHFLIKD